MPHNPIERREYLGGVCLYQESDDFIVVDGKQNNPAKRCLFTLQ